MGKTTEQWHMRIQAAEATAATQDAIEARNRRESQLFHTEAMLGDAGDYNLTAEMLPYTQRLDVDTEVLASLGQGKARWGHDNRMTRNWGAAAEMVKDVTGNASWQQFSSVGEFGNFVVSQYNGIMDEAEAMARAGDMEGAEAKRLEAEKWRGINPSGQSVQGAAWSNAFEVVDDPQARAEMAASSPMFKTASELVRQGREFLDPESETSQRYKRALTEPGMRALAMGERAAQRQSRDFALAQGGAMNPLARMQAGQTAERDFAAQRAQLLSNAALQYENFSRSFAADAVNFGQAFLQNQSGVREAFQGAQDALHVSTAGLFDNAAARGIELMKIEAAEDAARDARQANYINAGVQLASAAMGMFSFKGSF